ncbi:hypothetical protein RA210_U280004 [Rubrivivax sp. A210]|nr:hypothetical protein RA210_U280004 [Rubrivivax sp. A210]
MNYSIRVLSDAPQDARRIEKAEVPHFPRLRFYGGYLDTVFVCHSAGSHVLPPGIDIFYEDVHHEVFGEMLCAEVLQ